MPIIFTQRQFRAVFLIAGILGAFFFIVNILILGGDEFVCNLNNFVVSPLAIITAIPAATLWGGLCLVQQLLIWGISPIVISLTTFFITLVQIGLSAFSNDTQLKKAEITLSIRADRKWIFDEILASLMDVK